MPKTFSRIKKLYKISAVFLLLFIFLISSSTAQAIMYQPGETLDPSCLPSDAGCGVNTASFSDTLTISSVASPSIPTDQLYNVGGALFWNGTQISGLSSINSLNGLTDTIQTFLIGTSGTDFSITSSGSAHVFNLPSSSSSSRGLLTSADWSTFNAKQDAGDYLTAIFADGPLSGTGTSANHLTIDLSDYVTTSRTVNGHALSSDVSVTKSDLGIGNVEDTALSTWAGSGNITTLGTIVTGTWSGTAIALAKGGTGSTDGSIAGSGALSFVSATTNALTLDSETTGTVNLGTGSFAKTLNIGNTTGATALNLKSGTGNINLQVAGTSTTGNVQIGAGGAGSATPDLLVLDVKNTAGDPTGTTGAIYYNSSKKKFRCYQNGAWADCISSSGNNSYFKGKSTDQSITSTTTLTSDSELTFPISAGETWAINYDLYLTNNNSGQPDLKIAILGASGWTCSLQMSGFESAGTNFPQIVTTDCDDTPTDMVNASIGNDSGKGMTVHILGTITATTSGNVTLQFAQNTSSLNPLTLKAGSYVAAFRTTGSDVAEIYYGKEALATGSVVSLNPEIANGITKSSGTNDKNLLGVISTRPGLIIGDNLTSQDGIPTFVALSGRVPVAVSKENGTIKPGDYLTSSSTPGVAMRANKDSIIIGQALSGFEGNNIGQVLMFVKNFDLSSNSILFEDISKTDGLTTEFISEIQNEEPQDPIAVITKKINDGQQFLTNFIVARITAIRGYFDELFARKIHTDQLCIRKTDSSEICIDGNQLDAILQNANDVPPSLPIIIEQSPAEQIQEDTANTDDNSSVEGEQVVTDTPKEAPDVTEIDAPLPKPQPSVSEPVTDLPPAEEIAPVVDQ